MPKSIKSVAELNFKPKSAPFPSPKDWRDLFIYFLLVDRFDNNKKNIPAYDENAPKGRDAEEGKVFQGGNLKGVLRRLDYIQGLGANAIWLSPVLKNRAEKNDTYHGYGIQNFLDVDPRFGTLADLKKLVKEAHSRGMYVIMDIIINHTGDNWAYPGDFPYYFQKNAGPFPFGFWRKVDSGPEFKEDDAVWPEELREQEFYKRRGQITNWFDADQAVNGDFLSLKEFAIGRPEVLDSLIKCYKYWISAIDVDGFRIDTVKHIEDSSAAIFCNAIREFAKRIGKENFFIFGEVVADDDTLQRYIGRNSRIEGTIERFPSLDACLDFPLYFILEEVIKGFTNPSVLRERYDRFKLYYSDHGAAGEYFVTFVDNHDQMARPYKRFMHDNPFPEQVILAIGYLLTSHGVPCIYYGTEQGFNGGGGNDSFVRECMFGGKWGAFDTTGRHFFDTENPIYKEISKIADIRRNEPALRYGRLYFREASADGKDFGYPIDGRCTLAYSRVLDDYEVVIAMNIDKDLRSEYITVDKNLNPEGESFNDLLDPARSFKVEARGGRHAVKIDLEGHKMAILKRKTQF